MRLLEYVEALERVAASRRAPGLVSQEAIVHQSDMPQHLQLPVNLNKGYSVLNVLRLMQGRVFGSMQRDVAAFPLMLHELQARARNADVLPSQ